MYINAEGLIYSGDMAVGDREATVQEVFAWEASKGPTKQHKIDELLQSVGYVQEWMLDRDIAYALAIAQIGGVTEPVLYASNAAYHMAKDLKAQITVIRGAP